MKIINGTKQQNSVHLSETKQLNFDKEKQMKNMNEMFEMMAAERPKS